MTTESTASELRKTGISVIGEVRWGTHFCYFYETKQDLLETLVLYFKAGLENKEFCLWVVSRALTVEEAKRALGQAVPDLDRHFAEGGLEIHGHDEWYLGGGRWDAQRVLQSWREKLNQTSANGHAGLRASGDAGWIQNDDWMAFREYEKQVDVLIADQRSIILCTYPLATSPGNQVFDVAHVHQLAAARRNGNWEIIETPALKEAKAQIKRLNEELEQKVEERTRELAATNEALRSEIAERTRAEAAVKQGEDRLRRVIDTIPTMAWSLRPDGVLDFLNQRWLDYTGLSLQEAIEEPTRTVHPEDLPRVMEKWLVVNATSEVYEDEMRLRRADGDYRWFLIRIAPLLDQQGSIVKRYGVAIDIEERKQAEEALRESENKFRRLLASNITGVVFWSLQGEVLDANDLFLNTVGYTREDLRQGKLSWKKLTPPEYVHVDEKAIGELTSTGTCARFEKEYIRKDGSRVSVLIGSALLEPKKDVGSSFVMDITERKRVELALDERLRFETLLTELSAAFANLPTTAVDQEIDKWLQNLVEFLDLDRAIVDQVGEDGLTLSRSHSHTARGIDTRPLDLANNQTPWITEQLLRGNTVKWSRIPDDIPEQASKEKEFAGRIGAKSVLSIPVYIGGSVICAVSFTSIRIYREWTDEMVARLRLVGEIFANAIARKRAEEALFRREAELSEAQGLASIGSWEWDILSEALTYSDELRRIYGFEREDSSSSDRAFSEAVHPDDRARRSAAVDAALKGGPPYNMEFRIIRPDKSVRFVHSRGRLIHDEAGTPIRMVGMAQDITERKEAEEALRKANRQLQILSRRRIQMQEEERRHLARELHDQIGQLLTAGNINLQSARKTKDRRAMTRKLDETSAILEQILGQVRQISFDIRPPVLDDLGLAPAMRWMVDDTAARAGLTAEFFADPNLKRGDLESETACYRVGLEAVANVVRHAQARKIWMELRNVDNALQLLVRDDGIGFDAADAEKRVRRDRLGLVGMRERATAVGGQFECKSARGRGTEIRASFPISSKRDESNPL